MSNIFDFYNAFTKVGTYHKGGNGRQASPHSLIKSKVLLFLCTCTHKYHDAGDGQAFSIIGIRWSAFQD